MEKEVIPELVSAITKEKGLLTEIYHDMGKPGVSQVGNAIGTICGLCNSLLLPIALANEKCKSILHKNMESYRKQLQDQPEETITEVPPEIGVPILDKFSYITNDEISDLYVNLLSKASITHSNSLAHPAFAKIIESLSPDEALILKFLIGKRSIPFVDFIVRGRGGRFKTLDMGVTNLSLHVNLQYTGNIQAYLSNLEALGIINSRRDVWEDDHKYYEEILANLTPTNVNTEKGEKQDYNKGVFDITDFGKLFIKACCQKINDE